MNCPRCKQNKNILIKGNIYYCLICKKAFVLQNKTSVPQDGTSDILKFYQKLNLSLVKLKPQSKIPIELNWQNSPHKDIKEWKEWLLEGYNIGINLGLSNLMAIDFDDVKTYEKLKDKFNSTLIQKTTHGYHLIYKYFDISASNLRPKYPLEIRSYSQQIVIEPSETDGFKRYFINRIAPAEMSQETKEFLLNELKNKPKQQKIEYEIKSVPEGNRHYDLISVGGHFKNVGFAPKQIHKILTFINNRYYAQPKPNDEIEHICDSLYGYQLSEEEEIKREIIDYLKKAEEATKAEIEIALFNNRIKGEKKKKIDRLLVELIKESKIYKDKRSYKIAVDPGWTDDLSIEINNPLNIKVPYLYDVANFYEGDVTLISAKTGIGKTTFAVNICKRLIEQGVKPYLFEIEPSKRFLRTAHILGLSRNEFIYNKNVVNPATIEFADNAISIIDWLDPGTFADFTQTSKIFFHFNEQARKHNTYIIVFMQLREDTKFAKNQQFAKDQVNQYPSLVVNFILEEDRIHSKLQVKKNNDAKIPYIWEIPLIYNSFTREIKRADEIAPNRPVSHFKGGVAEK